MPELNLKYPGFTYSAWGLFTRHRERIQKLRDWSKLKHLFRNELNKLCVAHDAAYFDNENLAKRSFFDKILIDKACEIARISEDDSYQRAVTSMLLCS